MGTINIDGGTLVANRIYAGGNDAAQTVSLDGGTLQAATGANLNFIASQIGTLSLDANNADIDSTIDTIKITTDPKKRDALLREGLLTTRDQAYYVPLHHQLRPWAMKKNVTTVHKADDRPESRFARIN